MSRILLIEDNLQNARLVLRVLKNHGHEIIHAETGESGFRMAIETQPDLILIDMGLPDVDGQTIAATLKQTPVVKDIPMVAVTAWPESTAREMVRAYGCDGYIPKPIDTRKFPQQVADFLKET